MAKTAWPDSFQVANTKANHQQRRAHATAELKHRENLNTDPPGVIQHAWGEPFYMMRGFTKQESLFGKENYRRIYDQFNRIKQRHTALSETW